MSAGFPELDDLYGSADAPPPPAHAPLWPVYAAALAALVSAVTLVWASQDMIWWGLAGYLLGGLGTPLLTIVYRMQRRSARKRPSYVPRPTWERVLVAATVAGIVLGVGHAWFVATELAKQ